MRDSIHNGYAVELKRLLLRRFCSLFKTFISAPLVFQEVIFFSCQTLRRDFKAIPFVPASSKLEKNFLLFHRRRSVFYMQLLLNTLPQRRPVGNLNYRRFFFCSQLKSWGDCERLHGVSLSAIQVHHHGYSAPQTAQGHPAYTAEPRRARPACAFRSAETRKLHKRGTLELLW